jgi:MFS family permease
MSIARDIYLTRCPLAGFVAIGLAWAIYFAQMPVIKANVGASDGAYGIALLISAFGALAAMWLAPAARRWTGGMSIPLGILLVAIGMLSAGLSGHLIMLTIAMFLSSAGSGIVDVLINARVSEIEEQSKRALMNLNHALYSFAYAAGALVTGFLREEAIGPIPIFLGLAVLLCLLACVAYDVPPDLDEGERRAAPHMQHTLVILVGLIVLTAFLAEASTEGWSALHLERTLNGSPGEGALGPAMLGLTMGIGRLFGHSLSHRIKDTYLMWIATLVSATGVTIAALASNVPVALAGFAIAGLGISVVAPLALALIGRVVPPSHRLTAISRASVIGYGAFFIGPSMMGLVSQAFGLPFAFLFIAGLLVCTALLVIPAVIRRV